VSIKILEKELFSGPFIPVSLRSCLSLHLRNAAAAESTIETARDSRRRNETVFCEDVAADDDGDDKSRRTTVNYKRSSASNCLFRHMASYSKPQVFKNLEEELLNYC
jgi:hypothetical protein